MGLVVVRLWFLSARKPSDRRCRPPRPSEWRGDEHRSARSCMGRTIGVLEHKDADAARQRSAAVQQLRPGRVILLRSAKGSAMVDVILFPAARRRRSIRLSQCVSAGGTNRYRSTAPWPFAGGQSDCLSEFPPGGQTDTGRRLRGTDEGSREGRASAG